MLEKRHRSVLCPDYITKVKRWSAHEIDDLGNVVLAPDEHGKIYEAMDADQKKATSEFWRVMHAVVQSL